MKKILICFLFLIPSLLFGKQSLEEMIEALEIARYWDQRLEERFPLTFNQILSTGYFTTHSARMVEEGSVGFGIAKATPYLNWNICMQPFWFLELTASYRIFCGVKDVGLSPYGFGDYADRGANFKAALCTPEQSSYKLPGIAFGVDDFMGTKKFLTYYIVGTQVLTDYGLEGSFGWGGGRYSHGPSRGFFGGINWFPGYSCASDNWYRRFCLTAEYDPIHYSDPEKEPHHAGRTSKSPINFGAKYASNLLEFSASVIRGEAFACAGSFHYNWGKTKGFLPKIGDPLPYEAPRDTEPLGCSRHEDVMIQTMNYAFEEQGFQITVARIEGDRLWMRLFNCYYRNESIVKMRLQRLLAALTPSNVSEVIIVLEAYGLPCQQYVFNRLALLRSLEGRIGPYEYAIITPREEASFPCLNDSRLIFKRRNDLWRVCLSPRYETFFGSASGKFKYDLGLKADIEGFLPYNLFYEVQASYTLRSTIHGIADYDLYNPSQLPVVATDYIRYRQEGAFSWDRLYMQKSWNYGCGFFGRMALGYFQVNYAGAAGELLWYPADACFGIGLQGAVVEKRKYSGLGFQTKLKKLKGYKPTFKPYDTLQQYFLDIYLDFPSWYIFTKASVGQFLARDKGVRLEATRYFDNGIRLSGWITFTNAKDKMHGKTYFDRGVCVEIPFDFFFKKSSKRVWSYGMAAWLRDAGYATSTGKTLFEILNRERRF